MHLSATLTGAVGLAFVLASPAPAQHPVVAPSTWAITGARIEPVSGPTIAKGTVVIRDGLIAAVGANVKPPADARIIDGTGLTVYPGLIDAYGSIGMPSSNSSGRQGAAQGAGTSELARDVAPNSNYDRGMQAELAAVAAYQNNPKQVAAAHKAGVAAALTALPQGIFRGSAALMALRDGEVPALVIRQGVAQSIGFSRGPGDGFPRSLMGVIAQFRQELLDAQHYRDLKAVYASDPRGRPRPDHDPTLEALLPVLAGTEPVLLHVNSEREIRRALSLAHEFNIKPIIAGGAEAWKVADLLAAQRVPVLLDIDFPHRTANSRGGDSDQPESMRVLRSRVEQPRAPLKLAQAGVDFAFYSGGDYSKYLSNVRQAVSDGLDPGMALRAMTISPARLFGASDRLGTIEPGKIANLTVVRGDLMADGARMTAVFVDGHRFEIATSDSTTSNPGSRRNGGAR